MSSTPFSKLLEQAATAKFEVIPDGWYHMVCKDASATKSSTNKDMIKLSTKVVVGPHSGSNVLGQQTLTDGNPAAVAMFMKFLGAFGLDEEWLAALPPREDGGPDFAAVATALKGRPAMVEVGHHEWNGDDRNDHKSFKLPTDEQLAAIEAGLATMGQELVKGTPKAGAADPFAAAAAPTNGGAAGGLVTDKPADEPF